MIIDVENNLDKKLIIGGDFNLCLKSIDNSKNILKKSKARDDVIKMMETYNLLDIWRIHHPDTKRFSWRRNNPIFNVDLTICLLEQNCVMMFQILISNLP